LLLLLVLTSCIIWQPAAAGGATPELQRMARHGKIEGRDAAEAATALVPDMVSPFFRESGRQVGEVLELRQ